MITTVQYCITIMGRRRDDDARVTGLLESYIEWTCPSDGVYYVLVKAYSLETGRFQVRATEANAGNGGDPCVEGTRLGLLPGAELTSTDPNDWIEAAIISFKPDGNYQDDAICVWQIQCQPDQVVSLTFLDFNTEEGYDWVSLNGGDIPRDNYVLSQMLNQGGIGMPPTDNALIMTHSGRFADMAETHFTSIDEEEVDDPSALTLSFESDASIGGEGFEASYACQTPTEVEQSRGCRDLNTQCAQVLAALGGPAVACERDLSPLLQGTGGELCPVSCNACAPGTGTGGRR